MRKYSAICYIVNNNPMMGHKGRVTWEGRELTILRTVHAESREEAIEKINKQLEFKEWFT